MFAKHGFFMILLVVTALMVAGAVPLFVNVARASPPAQAAQPSATTIPYTAILRDDAGQPVVDGVYDFTFALFLGPAEGAPLWSETQVGVVVRSGSLATLLGSVNPIPGDILADGQRWLAVSVRGPYETEFTALNPRQALRGQVGVLTAGATQAPSCPHDHLGETWIGEPGLWGLLVQNNLAQGVGVFSVAGSGANAKGVYGSSDNGIGVYGSSGAQHGVFGETTGDWGWASGVYGKADKDHADGVTGWNTGAGVGVYAYSESGTALFAKGKTGNLIEAWDAEPNDQRFRVDNAGRAYADGGWQGAADFAELMVPDEPATTLSPGDVLVIGANADRTVKRSTTANSTLVVGVYSKHPGFVGSPNPMQDSGVDEVPVAMLGIVKCKVSAENGPIQRGDLLVTSSTPGHAMRTADPRPGVILGKALESLEHGTGMIEILVTLQ